MKLVVRLIAGIVAGLLIGLYAPEFISRLFITFKAIFGQFISFTIPLIILFFITSGIAGLKQGAGKALGVTVGVAYLSTIAAGTLAFFIARVVVPELTGGTEALASGEGAGLAPFAFAASLEIPPLMGIMTALVAAFMFGIGISAAGSSTLKKVADQGRDIVELVLSKVLIPLLPLYICGVFVGMTVEGTVFETLKTFGVVLILALCVHWIWLAVLYTAAGTMSGRSPVRMLKNMLPAYFTAVGTMSSAATIPITVNQSRKNGIDNNIVDFAVPLCATIHLSGSVVTLVTCSTAVMMLSGMGLPDLSTMFTFIGLLGVTLIAAPGAPGGAVMAALGVLASVLGFGESAIALMIALYLAQDSFGTACNVTGDGAIAALVECFAGDSLNDTDEAKKSGNAIVS
ncbi:dicarboxylate/amino acid:cation symporter [Endozoicomonas sp. Mp262]|uniref:dicarboxylate/amino acid:cation symporter n=1 Tax=Endozoicomonas sp. Mp262 TaxID=2919499 RepID=UPI0021DADD1E